MSFKSIEILQAKHDESLNLNNVEKILLYLGHGTKQNLVSSGVREEILKDYSQVIGDISQEINL